MKYYYARHWHYGIATGNNYEPCCSYHAFVSKKKRDDFVDNGVNYRTEGGFRDIVKASDPYLRRILNTNHRIYNNNQLITTGNPKYDSMTKSLDKNNLKRNS